MADGEVTIKATLDSSGVDSGAKRVKSSLEGIESSGKSAMGGTGKAAASASDKINTMANVATASTAAGQTINQGITEPLKNVVTQSVQTASAFEQTMNSIQAMTGASDSEIQQLDTLATKMGADTKYNANECADAILELNKAGVSNQDIMGGVLESTLKLATDGDMSIASASTVASNAMHQFGLSADNTDEIVTALAGGANASLADVSSLGQGLGNVGTVANSAGMSLQDTVAVLSAFSDAGIDGAEGGTQLKSMLMKIQNPSDKTETAMKAVGLSFYDAEGHMKSMGEIADELNAKLGGLSEEERNRKLGQIFGTYAVNGANILMKQGSAGLQKYQQATYDAAGAQELFDSKMSGTQGAIEQASGAIDTAQKTLGTALAPIVVKVANLVADLAQKFSELPDGAKLAIVGALGVVSAIGVLMLAVGTIGSGITTFKELFGALKGIGKGAKMIGGNAPSAARGLVQLGAGEQAASAPAKNFKTILSYAAAIAAVGAAVVMIGAGIWLIANAATTLAQGGTVAIAVFFGMVAAIAALVGVLALAAPALSTGTVGIVAFGAAVLMAGAGLFLIAAGASLFLMALTGLAAQLPVIQAYGASAALALAQLALGVTALGAGLIIFGAGAMVGGAGALVLGAGLLLVGAGITAIAAGVLLLITDLKLLGVTDDQIVNGIKTAWNDLKGFMQGVGDAINGIFQGVVDGVRNIWNSTIGGKGITLPDWLPVGGGTTFSIPMLAEGGIATSATLAMIGEGRSDEAVIPLDKLSGYLPAAQGQSFDYSAMGAAMMAAMSQVSLNVNGKKLSQMTAGDRDGVDGNRQRLVDRGLAL